MTTVCIIGAGYVGLTYAAGLTLKNLKVNMVDVNPEVVNKVNNYLCPIDEPKLQECFIKAGKKGLLKCFENLRDVFEESDLFLVCVGTYCDDKGNIDLSQVKAVANDLKECFDEFKKVGYKVICIKSTVICGTTDSVVLPIIESSGKKAGKDFGLSMSPEFLKEGSALDDILHPDKIVIGGLDQVSINVVRNVLKCFLEKNEEKKIFETDIRTAELIKYAQNSFLATKISFINEISRFSELFGVNVGDVAKALGIDSRISSKFLNAGPGFGGSCFPKDVMALFTAGKQAGYHPTLLEAVLEVNRQQKKHVIELLQESREISGLSVSILGLSFKANTGDTRESVSRSVVPELIKLGVNNIKLHDPSDHAREEFKRDFPADDIISYHDNIPETIENANVCFILTEWEDYRGLIQENFESMGEIPLVIDCRRILKREGFKSKSIELKVLGESSDTTFKP